MGKNPTILGIHIGHDASASVLLEGRIVGHTLRERHSKVRHHLGIDRQTIEMTLQKSKLTLDDIDVIAITATQQIPSVINDADWFSFSEQPVDKKLNPFRLIDNPYWKDSKKFIVERWRGGRAPDWITHFLKARGVDSNHNHLNAEFLGIVSPCFGPAYWLKPYSISNQFEQVIHAINSKNISPHITPPLESFHFPVTARLGKRSIPGYFINHHMAHAASSYYSTPVQNSLIFTHDGGTGLDSGFYFLGSDNKISCLTPHHLECGQFYDYVADKLGLGTLGGAGKLMGLAPYGKGILDGLLPVGTLLDWRQWSRLNNISSNSDIYQALFSELVDSAKSKGLDISRIGDPTEILSGAPAEIAHAVQNLLESSIQSSIIQTADAVRQKGLVEHADHLCISGGVALNCPSNTKLWESGRFKQIHIEPHCEDGGLSIGAANFVLHHFYDEQKKSIAPPTSQYAMMGSECDIEIPDVLHSYKEKILWESLDQWEHVAANAIADNFVIAVYYESYETGPRALGHRSILANPIYEKNWEKVNLIKKRELWRPFAPAVLATDIFEWFENGPSSSPFMLFTHKLLECRKGQLPAVTHVDQTARVQTVTALDEPLYSILSQLKCKGHPPVLLNTSFNGPGKPIMQDPHDAIEMLLQSEIDFLFINGFSIRKNPNYHLL